MLTVEMAFCHHFDYCVMYDQHLSMFVAGDVYVLLNICRTHSQGNIVMAFDYLVL